MKNKSMFRRALALVLTVVMLAGLAIPAGAAEASNTSKLKFTEVDSEFAAGKLSAAEVEEETPLYAEDEIVRVSIVLEDESTIAAGYSTLNIAQNASAMAYRQSLQDKQEAISASIERSVLDNQTLNVVWNLTLAANLISAEVAYGDIDEIAAIAGVKEVVIETQYEPMVVSDNEGVDPNMATSGEQIGSMAAWAAGYTGAGSRIAVIDTGADLDHRSFDAGAFEYSLQQLGGEYDLLDTEEIAGVLDKLNVKATAEELYVNSKIPFGFNYVDSNLTIDHDHDSKGGHGSHVAGIATANAYIPDGQGGYVAAIDSVKTQGVAPDAQLLVMKVFGASGGAYDSDYMAAIEDAILLGADSVNLSLGSGNPGFSRCATYQDIMDMLSTTETVVVMSAGNSYGWADNGMFEYLFADDVSMQTGGSPGSYTNSLGVASVNNDGTTGYLLYVDGVGISYTDSSSNGYKNTPMTSLAGEQEFIFFENTGVDKDGNSLIAEYADVIAGKIVLVSRGESSFYQKHDAAAEAGAIGCIVYNNQAGIINMDLSSSTATIPCISVTQADGALIKASGTAIEADGAVIYYTGTITVGDSIDAAQYNSNYYTMSDFSSWGVPGSLELKPEITAPGGSIYSVDGEIAGGEAYVVMSGTSMAAPQVSGMVALVAQYIREKGLDTQEGITARTLAQSLLMSTAEPVFEAESGGQYYSVLKQGAGLANVGSAVSADSYILMNADATDSYADGKVKVELGDDPARSGDYSFSFTVNNLTDEAQRYTMSADFFTQDVFYGYGELLLDTWTRLLAANATFTVDGKVLAVESMVNADVDKDGDTDTDDAQAVLNYTAGTNDGSTYDLAAADVDADGQVDTYDAYLILSGFNSSTFEVPADGKVNVSVNFKLTNDCKAFLDAYYVSGAYVEGYVYVEAVSTEEGSKGVGHSIPVLGFYGNWSDASMYDRVSFIENLYDDDLTDADSYSYVSGALGRYWTNNLVLRYPGDKTNYSYTINPYILEEDTPIERAAINSSTTLYQQQLTLIRNAAALAAYAMDQDGNIIYMGSLVEQAQSAYYYVNGGYWTNIDAALKVNKKVSSFGVEEGDVITFGLVAVPEYYETDGAITEEQLKALITEGKLGQGAFLSNTFVVDDTAPELISVSKDLTTGDLTIVAQDNNYISAIGVTNRSGSKTYAMGVPQQTEGNEKVSYLAEVGEAGVGEYCTIVVCDYAGNETYYTVEYGGEPENYAGRMLGFTTAGMRGSGPRWVEITPSELYYKSSEDNGGLADFAPFDMNVYAAAFMDGYVFFASADGWIYASPLDDMLAYKPVACYADYTANKLIRAMSYNHADGKLYAIDDARKLYTIDTVKGTLEYQYLVYSTYDITSMAIDENGTFYGVNESGAPAFTYLYTWTNDMENNDRVTATKNKTKLGTSVYSTGYGSMAWDYDNDILYYASARGYSYGATDSYNRLWVIDTTTGNATAANSLNSHLRVDVSALFFVPMSYNGSSGGEENVDVARVDINMSELTMLEGAVYNVYADVYPWNAGDKSIVWTSDDESIATVENGAITAIKAGSTTIRATSVTNPEVYDSISITVETLPNTQFSGLIYDPDGNTTWAEFQTDDLTKWNDIVEAGNYIGGAQLGLNIYVHNGSNLFAIDADTFEVTPYGGIVSDWLWADAAAAPATEKGRFGVIVAPCYGGQLLEMINVEKGSLSYFDMSATFADDPMATIAYVSSGLYKSYPAHNYYVLTENGYLYSLTLYATDSGIKNVMSLVSHADISLEGVSAVTAGIYASMIYDAESGYLLLSAYTEGETCDLYAIDPATGMYASLGNFGKDYWPVVSLYQYDRALDLSLRFNMSEKSIFVEDSFTLEVEAILGETNEVTFQSSNEAVATVDENGLVTGISAGNATITITTVDVNDNGEHVTASCEVTVKPLVTASGSVKAQLHTEDGPVWVTINLADRSYTVNGEANAVLTGGGAYGSKSLFGADVDLNGSENGYLYKIDPVTFEETVGSACSPYYAPRDLTDAPYYYYTYYEDDWNIYEFEGFGMPMYLGNSDNIYLIQNYKSGSIIEFESGNSDLAAIAYVGSVEVGELGDLSEMVDDYYYYYVDEDCPAHVYYVLAQDGTLYQYIATAAVSDYDWEFTYLMIGSKLGNIGLSFPDVTSLSMAYCEKQLVISDMANGIAELFVVDLTSDTLKAGKVGNIAGTTGISCLYSASAEAADTQLEGLVQDMEDAAIVEGVEVEVSETPELPEEEGDAAIAAGVDQSFETSGAAGQPTGSLNSYVGQVSEDESVYDLTITLDEAASNGKYTVSYNPEEVELVGVSVTAAYKAVNTAEDGTVVFTFAGTGVIPADGTVAVLSFKVLIDDTSDVTVTVDELNEEYPATSEVLSVGEEKSIIVRPVEPEQPEDPDDPIGPEDPADPDEPDDPEDPDDPEPPVEEPLPFTDVSENDWFYEDVKYVYENGLMNGVSETLFAPYEEMSRAMVVTVLYRMDGSPAASGSNSFTDLTADWYKAAVQWAVANGITKGVSETRFDPDAKVTREQLVTFLYRYAQYKGMDVSSGEGTDLSSFADAASVSAYAVDAVKWAVAEGIIKGSDKGLEPAAGANRAQAAAILHRFLSIP